ncbi:peptidase S9 [Haloprofundus marisrubri]|uniref:Peptidase S9 n=1 Tax=Haloprofundus marisrubri TaxID=1514971 RepID=A0A0W1R7K5_9EURY|nr:S9 family peptidase [Haloprofundus marisrubri]KTG09111.1 peptidase S9 [Haloprofundus marisrubri]
MTDDTFTPMDLARLPSFHHPKLSPDGDRVALYYDESGRNELHVIDVESGERRRITDGEVPRNARWPVAWDATGERVFFHLDANGDEQNDIHAVALNDDGEMASVGPVVEIEGQAILHDVTEDGRYLLYTSDANQQMNVYRYDTESGETEQLTEYAFPAGNASFSPDGERVAYAANDTENLENYDAYVMNADGSEKQKLDVGTVGTEVGPSDWHPDGDAVLVTDNSEDLGRAGVYDLESDEVEWLGDGEHEESGVTFGPEGDRVVVTRMREAGTLPVVYDLETGESEEFELPEGVANVGGSVADDGTLLVTHTTPTARPTLLAYDLDSHESMTLVEPDYGDIDPEAFVDAEYVTYESTDGLDIGALLYDARETAAGSDPSPAVVMVHGGPHSWSSKAFNLYAQFLAAKGYTVLLPNYRGSIGRGREFKNAIHGDWGGLEQEDIAAGARWLADEEWVDDDRLAVFGGSYGGYSTFMQLVQRPELWKTGVAWVGITDLHLMHEEAMPHYQTFLETQMGDPEDDYELWRDRSAIEHVEKAEPPLYIVHGVNDVRCPISQARVFRDALKERGWTEAEGGVSASGASGDSSQAERSDGEFEYTELGEEGHGSTDIDQKVRAYSYVGDYLDRRL